MNFGLCHLKLSFLLSSFIERFNQIAVPFLQGPPLHLLGGRHISVLLIEPPGQEGESLDRLHLGEGFVHLCNLLIDELLNLWVLGQVCKGGKRNSVVLSILRHIVLVDQDEGDEVSPMTTES
jgi:hypothetical protein